MRASYLTTHLPLLGIAIAVSFGTAACSPATSSTTTVTAASVEPTPSIPTAMNAVVKEATPTSSDRVAFGQPACRVKSAALGTVDLLLSWDGTAAKGSLEQVAPSGSVTSQRVHAERYKGMIVADDVTETDLVNHAAVVAEKDGKRYMRVGNDSQPWLACE